jgi:hypothetical protein
MNDGCSIVVSKIAPEGSVCEICGNPAPWQMYCKDCGHILRFYCGEHAYLSQGDIKLEMLIKTTYYNKPPLNTEKDIENAKKEWRMYLNKCH